MKRFGTTRVSHHGAGFTLLEVLVATAILGTSVAALFSLLSGSLGNMTKLRGPSQALLLGQSRLNELLAQGIPADQGAEAAIPINQKMEGRWNEQYRWEALATHMPPDADVSPGQTVLVRIALDVYWTPAPGKNEKKLSLETYQLRREPSRAIQ